MVRWRLAGRGVAWPTVAYSEGCAVGSSGVRARHSVKATAKRSSRLKTTSQRTKAMKANIKRDRTRYGCCRPLSKSGSTSRHIFRRYDGETWTRSCFEK